MNYDINLAWHGFGKRHKMFWYEHCICIHLISLLKFIHCDGLFLLSFGSPYMGKTFQVLMICLCQGNSLGGHGARASLCLIVYLFCTSQGLLYVLEFKSIFVVTKC